MATSVHRILENFAWRIAAITPTNTLSRNSFEEYDPSYTDPPLNDGGIRTFYISWISSAQDVGATDLTMREAWHLFRVTMNYPVVYKWTELQQMILQDRHDIAEVIRDAKPYALGWDDDNTTDDIGLAQRNRVADRRTLEGDEAGHLIQVETDWSCYIRENE